MISEPITFGRFLHTIDMRRLPKYTFDVVVLGTGSAGASAALAASRHGANVGILAKSSLDDTNTRHAKGGMAAVMSPEDSIASHVGDTITVGQGLCHDAIVTAVARGGADAVSLLESLGATFDRHPDGSYDLGREGGHSTSRILHTHGAATGQEIQRVLGQAIAGDDRIMSFDHLFGLDVVTDGEGRARGILAIDAGCRPVLLEANAIVLATGGAGQVYRETTNPEVATGDGIAMAWRAGAIVRDMEFVQFHPTCLYIAGAARVLISEVVRGAGAILRDHDGNRFMVDVHPDAELAPRDVVSRAVMDRIIDTGQTNVWMDLSGINGDPHELFPGISRVCRFFGIDIATDPLPVRPGAHYMIGGVEVDEEGRSCVPGLYAAGECASSGLHGANRLGSNSLLEGLVLGPTAGIAAAHHRHRDPWTPPLPLAQPNLDATPEDVELNLSDLTYSLKSMMWRQVGLRRDTGDLQQVLEQLAFWTRAIDGGLPPTPQAWELVNMLTVSALIATGALARTESRGVHHRHDHNTMDGPMGMHIRQQCSVDGDRLHIASPLHVADALRSTTP